MTSSAELRQLLECYYKVWFRFHPEVAVDLGVNEFSDRLHPYDDDDIGALTVLNEKLLDSLDTIDLAKLSENERIDLELARGSAILELKDLIERDWRRLKPACFLPIHAIYQLTLRKVPDLKNALSKRLETIPAYLRGARAHLSSEPEAIPPIWLQSAIAEAHAGVGYFRDLRQHPQFARFKLDHLLEESARALEEFARFMQRELEPIAAGDFACGQEYFRLMLRHRHFLEVSPDDLYSFGKRLFEKTESELKTVTREIRGDDDIAAMTRSLHSGHPPASDLLSRYRDCMEAAHRFLETHELVSLPVREELKVIETPVFLRHQIPFAAYLDPQPNDPEQQGYYYVTPAFGDDALGEHNNISLQHTCVHEAWPGHHLQFVTANLNPIAQTIPRLLNISATLYEGWALYCEQLMQEQGFLQAPESKFVLLKDRLWRALRVMLDVELHMRGLSVEEAAARMQQALGFTREQALADLNWYTQSPTVPFGYATGWALINETRNRLQGLDNEFCLKDFHDKLLAAGSIALPIVLRSGFGKPLWDSVMREVFTLKDSQDDQAP